MESRRYLLVSNGSRKSCRFVVLAFNTAFVFAAGVLIGYFGKFRTCDKEGPNFDDQSFQNLVTLLHTIDVDEIKQSARYFSSKPHLAGSQRQTELAKVIKQRWESYGLEVQMPEYDVLISTSDENNPDYIKVVNDEGKTLVNHTFITKAKADPHDNRTWKVPQFFFYSPSGSVKGGLLYVNEGRKKDFEYLRNLNISSCNDSILILKQTMELHFRPVEQIENAYKCGATGVIFFHDVDPKANFPVDTSKTYPNTVWLPKDSPYAYPLIKNIGDPLTPGLPATKGTYRLDKKDVEIPVKLPVQLVDYSVAKKLLNCLKGRRMPDDWRPKSDKSTDYRVGPHLAQNATIELTVNAKTARQKVYNVVGTIYGNEEPDHWVLIGNHRDAIAFGGADPVSGTAAMMEVSRAVGELVRKGWKPRRTIKFCSWAAEEPGLIGSNEWVEENIKLLQERAVAYINLDMIVHGNYSFKSKGNPMLTDLIFSQTKLVHDPQGPDQTIFSIWSKRMPSTVDPSLPTFLTSARGTDYQPFYELAGVPCLDLQYTHKRTKYLPTYQAYHTPYDTYHWIKLVDPHFKIHLAQAQLTARLLFNLTDSLLIPFNLTYLSVSLEKILQRTKSYYKEQLRQHNVTLEYINEGVEKLKQAIQVFENIKNQASGVIDKKKERKVQMLNNRMVILQKMFLTPKGTPNRPWIKNLIYGISENSFYPNITLVAISDAIIEAQKSGKWTDVKHQISVTDHSIAQAMEALKMPNLD